MSQPVPTFQPRRQRLIVGQRREAKRRFAAQSFLNLCDKSPCRGKSLIGIAVLPDVITRFENRCHRKNELFMSFKLSNELG